MKDLEKPIDLNLWLNKDLIHRQNFLKGQFLDLFREVGNTFFTENFEDLSPNAKSSKISRGNDLDGMPYQVLDMIRDFDLLEGVNIRLLNWFGVGFFITILLGKNRTNPFEELLQDGFNFGLCESKWDYPGLILKKNHTSDASIILHHDPDFYQWFKELKIVADHGLNRDMLINEIKKILAILRLPSEQNRN